MSTAADKIKANAERLRAKTPAAPPAPNQPSQPVEPVIPVSAPASQPLMPAVVRQKSVRRTVDLSPVQHRALDTWQSQLADRLGLARVTGQEVLSALVDRLLSDDQLAAQISDTIAAKAAI